MTTATETPQVVTTARSKELVLDVDGLKMYFPITRGLLKRKVGEVKAVDGVSFKMRRGETLGLVGESGCGKTTVGRCISRLYKPTAGTILFNGEDITTMPEKEFRPRRRDISVIFQDPYGSLDPRQSAGSIVGEPLKIQGMVETKDTILRGSKHFSARWVLIPTSWDGTHTSSAGGSGSASASRGPWPTTQAW